MKNIKKAKAEINNSERTATRGFTVTKKDLDNLNSIKDKCLSKNIFLTDSAIVRLSLEIASTISDKDLIDASKRLRKIPLGRKKIIDIEK